MIVSDYSCDVCQKRRGQDSNRWWLVTEFSDGVLVNPWAVVAEGTREKREMKHACGETCCLQLVRQLMERVAPSRKGVTG